MLKWVIEVISSFGYGGIVFLLFLENIFPPIPSELIIPLTGFLVSTGQFSFFGVAAAGTFGSMLGALPFYFLGKKIGEERLRQLVAKYGHWLTISVKDIDRSKEWFDKYGVWTVFFCRFVPGIRSVISIPAGVQRMNFFTYLTASTLGMAVWTVILMSAGYLLKNNFEKVEDYLEPVSYFIIGGILVLYLYRVFRSKNCA